MLKSTFPAVLLVGNAEEAEDEEDEDEDEDEEEEEDEDEDEDEDEEEDEEDEEGDPQPNRQEVEGLMGDLGGMQGDGDDETPKTKRRRARRIGILPTVRGREGHKTMGLIGMAMATKLRESRTGTENKMSSTK